MSEADRKEIEQKSFLMKNIFLVLFGISVFMAFVVRRD
jgi:hypothetical protein